MIVRVKRHHLQYFRNKARKCSNEIYALLVGKRISPSIIEIDYIKYPTLEVSTPNEVQVDSKAFEKVYDIAKKDSLTVLGGIHSHPNYTPEMSPTDIRNHKDNSFSVSGIVGILNNKTTIRFWQVASSLPCKIEYY